MSVVCRRLRACCWALLLVSGVARGQTAPPGVPAAVPELVPIYSRQAIFGIPFKIELGNSSDERPTAVQLHVSEDGGLNWRLYEQVDPAASKFNFRAPHDGDYLFFVRTVDARGKLQPAAPPKPEMRVVVDTLAPRLELSAKQSPSGEVTVAWRMLDRYLRPETLKVEFQTRGSTQWQAVTVPTPAADQKTDTGEVTFWPGASSETIVIRSQVADLSGNPAVSQTEVGPGAQPGVRTAASRRDRAARDGETPWQAADDPASPGAQRWNADEASGQPLAAGHGVETLPPPPAMENVFPGTPLPDPAYVPTSTAPQEESISGPASEEIEPGAPIGGTPATRVPWEDNGPSLNAPPSGPAGGGGTWNADSAGAHAGQLGLDRLPPGVRPQMVNSRRFELDYEVESVGPAGVGKVELWGTRNGGQTWNSFGYDNDNRSPYLVAVDQQGVYGFRILVEAANGLGGLPPRGGDAPDVWVAVDLTPPAVRVLGVDAVADTAPGELVIRWEAGDAALASHPITLAFSDRAEGPWNVLAEGLDNSGRYGWRIDRRLPEQVFIQVQARDEAGNVGSAQSAEPVSLARLRPQGKIREVRPTREAKKKRAAVR